MDVGRHRLVDVARDDRHRHFDLAIARRLLDDRLFQGRVPGIGHRDTLPHTMTEKPVGTVG